MDIADIDQTLEDIDHTSNLAPLNPLVEGSSTKHQLVRKRPRSLVTSDDDEESQKMNAQLFDVCKLLCSYAGRSGHYVGLLSELLMEADNCRRC
jgi:hypothetical protein